MASLNKFIAIGRLTRDPEMRATPKGTQVCQFGMALNRTFSDESGTKRDETTFIDCEAWGKLAELVAKYLAKGSECCIEARLKTESWEDKTTGQKRSKLKVVLEQVQFLGSPKDKQAEAPATETKTFMNPREQTAPPARQAPTPPDNIDEDVPF